MQLLGDEVVFGIHGHTVYADFVMEPDTGFTAALANCGNGIATTHKFALVDQGMPQMRIERADLRKMAYLYGKSKTAMGAQLRNNTASRSIDGIANIGHKINTPVREVYFGERVANHLEPVPDRMPILERMDYGQRGRKFRIRFDTVEQPLKGGLYFSQALPLGKGDRLVGIGIVERKAKTAQFHSAVPEKLGFFGLEDGFIDRLSYAADFPLYGLVLAIDGHDIAIC